MRVASSILNCSEPKMREHGVNTIIKNPPCWLSQRYLTYTKPPAALTHLKVWQLQVKCHARKLIWVVGLTRSRASYAYISEAHRQKHSTHLVQPLGVPWLLSSICSMTSISPRRSIESSLQFPREWTLEQSPCSRTTCCGQSRMSSGASAGS
jgi:hypothetical protein